MEQIDIKTLADNIKKRLYLFVCRAWLRQNVTRA